MQIFRVGQRWVSESEPELGLGMVIEAEERHVEIAFDASESRRRYAKATAPLRRALFRAGDVVHARSGRRLVVRNVEENDGLLTYFGDTEHIVEQELSPVIGDDDPVDRLRRGRFDRSQVFDLREAAFAHLHRARTSRVRGLGGARIDLLPHQIFIAGEVARREAPRVLLADEVGLGKTIEACLVVHRMLLSGQAERVLVLVPEHLVHQWFVELLRRFNLSFRIFDEERCAAIEGEEGRNPFLEEQLVLCGLPLLGASEERRAQAAGAGWDLLVVDEAHHLAWHPGAPSPEYEVVAALAARSDGVLLLTGTPAQLGEEGHFARLRLLDPARYTDLSRYRAEAASYAEVAARLAPLAARVEGLPDDGSLVAAPAERAAEDALLDRYGPGRVMFRNTRASIGGFPRRLPVAAPLERPGDERVLAALAEEVDLRGRRAAGELGSFAPSYAGDPRIAWLAALMRAIAPEKLLVITQTPEQVTAIGEALAREVSVKRAIFHEQLSLVQRDRNAAYFAEEDGARVLLCSEIGSEGRNFQFAHHLALFDLPLDPELLEQRIGRLDRIGQTSDISIHVPYVTGSAQEVLFRWYHEGLDAFSRPLADGNAIHERLGARLSDLARGWHLRPAPDAGAAGDAPLDLLLRDGRALRDELAARLAAGRDRLLERSSFRPREAASLVEEIARLDAEEDLEDFMQQVFDHYGVEAEDLGERTYRLSAERLFIDVFPGLPAEGATVTFSRRVALKREDVSFLSWEHPMVLGAMELLVSSPAGGCAFATLEGARRGALLLEACFVLECPAPRRLGLDRFLPSTPVRVVVDHDLGDRSEELALADGERSRLRDAPSALREEVAGPLHELVPRMLARARSLAEARSAHMIEKSRERARSLLSGEIDRLVDLARENDAVRVEEIERLRARLVSIEERLGKAHARLDALRVIRCGP
ncbi:MAG TPA: RNA polymerase-associated protein RapA [Candidatus Bathyarchaeia archaeon]|nr:RNA polymerase-associated protein RapA [Candidatus Bathyarchaeia archaeon]